MVCLGLETIPVWLSYFLSAFTIIVITNAYNLIDGIDGLAGFTGLICTLFFGIWFYVIGEIGMASIALDIEVPNALRKGSHIYLQNIITDLLIGMKRFDILVQFIKSCISMGYRPGLITLNPVILDRELIKLDKELLKELIVCFNINAEGFNVFPSLFDVEEFIEAEHSYQLMGMSIFASGAANIPNSVEYIKRLKLDYVVFGTSRLENVNSNLKMFHE